MGIFQWIGTLLLVIISLSGLYECCKKLSYRELHIFHHFPPHGGNEGENEHIENVDPSEEEDGNDIPLSNKSAQAFWSRYAE